MCLCTELSVHVLFVTQDCVSVFYWDAENAEASSVDDKAVDYVLVFWQNKDAEKERKKITAYHAFNNRSIPFYDSSSYYTSLTNFYGCLYGCA